MNENRNSFPKYVGQSKSSFKRKILAMQGYLQKQEKSQINELYILVNFFLAGRNTINKAQSQQKKGNYKDQSGKNLKKTEKNNQNLNILLNIRDHCLKN